MADTESVVSKRLSSSDEGTDWLQLRYHNNVFDISVSGTFTGTVWLQRKRPDETAAAARDIKSFTVGAEETGEVRGRWDVRLFIKSGDISGGTVVAELGT